ncbi:MAG: Two component transcriptional regulator, winged helix family [Synergistales bacterium 53_16]|jgi:two-component system response regulator QseB|nr:MAG: Two component transcriptional regulator, winged helix family [Synergistales bacterium 53_16]KUL02249.1 MAG: Two component transcriptional regulator, winged helix family [Synergistales bacterium 54_9]MDK2846000.1 two-component system, OmpR family, response regulator QseB [Synergistales bacterium]MDN5335412.1 two-component system, OmpR family, response regulator QseB [Synergistales bacterium]
MIGEEIKTGLSRRGYTVDWVQDLESAAMALDLENFMLVVLDLGLPDGSGLELLQTLRAKRRQLPVIILTAWDAVQDRIRGLDCGADDYMVKPFELEELSARIRALTRRSRGEGTPIIRFGDLAVNPADMRVFRNESPLRLSRSEYTLLMTFLQNIGKILTEQELETALYGWEKGIESNAVQVHIHNLRKKIGPGIIKNIRGFGYLMEKPS